MRLYSAPMATFPRYAIYHVAAPGTDLDRFGAQLLGYDAYSDEDLPFPEGILQIAPDWRRLTKDQPKHGVHATLKPPMRLSPGQLGPALPAACARFPTAARP